MEALEARDVPATVSVTRLTDVFEGEEVLGAFQFTRTGGSSGVVTVNYSVTGTATADSDYTALTGTIDLSSAIGGVIIGLAALQDTLTEPTESVVLTLLPGDGYTVGTANTATVYILDDETPVVSVEASDTGEGTATGGFTFTRIGRLASALAVTYNVGGTATPTTDYRALSGTVGFAANQDRVEVRVEAFGDNTADDGETVIATLTGDGSTYTIDSTAGAATVTIADQPLTVSVERLSDGTEGTSNGVFRFTRSGNISSALTVAYTVGGTATSNADYDALSGTVTFAEDSDQVDVPVPVINDTDVEPTETVVVTLAASTAYELGIASDALFIRDNDTRRVHWISTSSTDWTVGANWTTGTVPLATDHVYVSNVTHNGVFISAGQLASISNAGSGLSTVAGLHMLDGYGGTATLANALSVGTFELTSGTLSQSDAAWTLTVTDALLWSGGTLNAINSGAAVSVSGATGVIDPPDTGSVSMASTLRVLDGALVTFLPGALHFLGGSGMYVADLGEVKMYTEKNVKVRFEDIGGSTAKKIEVAADGRMEFWKRKTENTGEIDFNIPILNRGIWSIEDGIQVTVKGRVGGEANRPSIEHHSGTWRVGSGSNIDAEFGTAILGGTFGVVGARQNPLTNIKGDFKFSGGTIEFVAGTAPYSILRVAGNMTWTGGTWKPRVSRVAPPADDPDANLPINRP